MAKKLTDGVNEAEVMVPEKIPAFLQKKSGEVVRGLEQVNADEDIIIPRLALCQAMSPQKDEDDPLYIPMIKEGDIFNTLTSEIYGNNSIDVIPLFMFKRALNVLQDGTIICTSGDSINCPKYGGCKCRDWPETRTPDNNKPPCMLIYNYLCILPNYNLSPAVVSLKSTGIKTAKRWTSLMQFRNTDSFGGVYRLTQTKQKNDRNQVYYAFAVNNAGNVNEEQYAFASNQYEKFMAQREKIQADTRGIHKEEPDLTNEPAEY